MIYIIFLFNIRNISIFGYVSVRYPILYPIPVEYPIRICIHPYLKNYNGYKYDKNIICTYAIGLQPTSSLTCYTALSDTRLVFYRGPPLYTDPHGHITISIACNAMTRARKTKFVCMCSPEIAIK
jgi:hypothetical protein